MSQNNNRTLALRTITIVFLDVLTMAFSGFFALWVRFDGRFSQIEGDYYRQMIKFTPLVIITYLIIYYGFRLYHSIWRFASVSELGRIILAYLVSIPVFILEIMILKISLPRSTYLIGYVINFLCCVAIRFSYRFLRYYKHRHNIENESGERVMIIGAGTAARELIRDISTSSKVRYNVICIIDDNSALKGKFLGNIPIVGTREDIQTASVKYDIDRIIYVIPSASSKERAEVLEICNKTGCHVSVIPGLYQLVNGEVNVTKLKDVDVLDLLARDEVKVNNQVIFDAIHDKVVLVTGGGGSIGSELCRQIARAKPKRLIIFDIYENNAYAIQNELKAAFPELDLVTLIGSVRNTNRVNWLLKTYEPQIVYHAAAHKHVPLMEESPCEAIKNNCLGTYKMARAAAAHKVSRFLLISTDKAVNPTNVMGASKRICEMIIQMMERKYEHTTFCAVRFGNVLGSNGSVIPLFKKQIEDGGPVTVTDPEIIRYFMTIPEAVALVLQASFYAKGGEIFVLDMGEPVRIDDMARRMIELSGFVPDVDIKVEYTGLRPGEKLYEELLIDKNRMAKTENDLIFIEEPYPMDDDKFMEQLEKLESAAKSELPADKMREIIKGVVPTYKPWEG